ncbi:MAG: hypothetical protein R2795_19065 [Saprospiraceae bacterium]
MQDWPTWVEMGYVDRLNVQCYRTHFAAYQATVSESWEYAAHAGLQKSQFMPGILLGIADACLVDAATLDSILSFNAECHFGGESFLYPMDYTRSSFSYGATSFL